MNKDSQTKTTCTLNLSLVFTDIDEARLFLIAYSDWKAFRKEGEDDLSSFIISKCLK